MKDTKYFEKAFLKQMKFIKRFAHSNIGYGGDVMPILELFNNLSSYDERIFFIDTLRDFLVSSDADRRDFAVDVCLGFVIFRNVIGR